MRFKSLDLFRLYEITDYRRSFDHLAVDYHFLRFLRILFPNKAYLKVLGSNVYSNEGTQPEFLGHGVLHVLDTVNTESSILSVE